MYESHVDMYFSNSTNYVGVSNVTADLIVDAQNDVSLCLKICSGLITPFYEAQVFDVINACISILRKVQGIPNCHTALCKIFR